MRLQYHLAHRSLVNYSLALGAAISLPAHAAELAVKL